MEEDIKLYSYIQSPHYQALKMSGNPSQSLLKPQAVIDKPGTNSPSL